VILERAAGLELVVMMRLAMGRGVRRGARSVLDADAI
jgi:hypothetical protein